MTQMSPIDPLAYGAAMPRSQTLGQRRAPRVVLYSHDTLGFGHLRRNMLLASAIRDCGHAPEVLLVAGMREAGAFTLPQGVDCLTLPAYAKASDGTYHARDLGIGVAALCDMRAATIRAAVKNFQPDLMIVDNVPRGAQYELGPTLQALKRSGRTRIVLGLRDIIDRPAVMRQQWLRQRNFEALHDYYDGIWIYGDPGFFPTAEEYGLGPDLARRVTYTGYLDQRARVSLEAPGADPLEVTGGDRRPFVLCQVGGGRDGMALCTAFAGAPMPAGHQGILITGTQMAPEAQARIAALARGRSDLTVVDFVAEPVGLASRAAALVAMCGYNTACEMMSFGRPSLVVPRIRPRAEQLIRAERMRDRGIADMIYPDRLSAPALGDWLATTVTPGAVTRGPVPGAVDLGGLARVTAMAARMLAPRKRQRHSA